MEVEDEPKKVKMSWTKPWSDRFVDTVRGDVAGCLQDAAALLREGRTVTLEPVE
jgi:hypothetical protein